MQVSDLNGRPIGRVVQANRESLFVSTGHSEFWISLNAVFTVEQNVTLLCNAESVDRYRV
jgi:hypothetical protein